MKALDCGHQPSPHGEHTTGTAHTPDGREVCWDCADRWTRDEIAATRPGEYVPTLYLSSDRQHLTTWNGTPMLRVTSCDVRAVGFGYRPSRTYLRATDDSGAAFYGTSPGAGMYARVRKAK